MTRAQTERSVCPIRIILRERPHVVLAHSNVMHAVLGQLANIELQLEAVAEEAAERVNHVETRR